MKLFLRYHELMLHPVEARFKILTHQQFNYQAYKKDSIIRKILAKSLWTHHPLFYRTQISVCSLVGNCLSSSQTSVLKLVTNFMVRPGSIITGWVWEQIYQFVNQTHLHNIDQNQTYQGTSSKCNLNNHIDHQGIHHHHQILTNSL